MIDRTIKDFVEVGIQNELVDPLDRLYVENRLLHLIGKEALQQPLQASEKLENQLDLLDQLIDYAVSEGTIEETFSAKDQLSAQIMDLLTPLPSQVNQHFWEKHESNPQQATDYFFHLSKANDYIKTRAIAQNIAFSHKTDYGELEITINLSKPEKDPKQIALEKNSKNSAYPSCLLCIENEGYQGTVTRPARANHRLIRMSVNEETWGFQYSPYAYYNEHAIFLSEEHRPMDVGRQALFNLLEIITTLPHYFVGSNAGLPIVGGSILSHDHYQGGRHVFPMEKAPVWHSFNLPNHTSVQADLIKWPMSLIRLTGKNVDELAEAGHYVMTKWAGYSDETVNIFAETNGTPHNAITPIARRKGEDYILDLVLRNNLTTEEFPDGVFHPHPEVQHIKKENIGLIEVMGLAILPPRLKKEMEEVAAFLLDESDEVKEYHRDWANKLKQRSIAITPENVDAIIEEGIGEVFLEVLIDAAVYKPTETGREAFLRFVNHLEK